MAELMKFAREDDEIYFWRLDWIGRSVIDVLNTVNDFTSRGIRLHSIMDNLDPTSVQGRMQLAIMATLAEYEREPPRCRLSRLRFRSRRWRRAGGLRS